MDISEYTKASAMYLKAEHVAKAKIPQFVIIGEPILTDKEFEGKKSQTLQVEGEMDEVAYKLDLSKTNARVISETLGTDTKTWNGCVIVLELYKTKATNGPKKGQLIDAINVKEAKKIL